MANPLCHWELMVSDGIQIAIFEETKGGAR